MSNFRLTMPTYLESNWTQLTRDGSFDRQDLTALKQTAAGQTGSKIQEALEIQTLDTLEQKLKLDQDASLKIDKVQVQAQNQGMGHAILEVSLLPETVAPASPGAPAPAPNRTSTAVQEPSSDEMNWASGIELKLKQQQPVATEDVERYKSICQRFLDSRKGKPAPSRQELQFANSVQRKQLAGQQPTAAEISRFQDINARQLLHVQAALARLPVPTQAPSQGDLDWVMQLQQMINTKDYLPSIDEVAKFQRILQAYQQFSPQAAQPAQAAQAR